MVALVGFPVNGLSRRDDFSRRSLWRSKNTDMYALICSGQTERQGDNDPAQRYVKKNGDLALSHNTIDVLCTVPHLLVGDSVEVGRNNSHRKGNNKPIQLTSNSAAFLGGSGPRELQSEKGAAHGTPPTIPVLQS